MKCLERSVHYSNETTEKWWRWGVGWVKHLPCLVRFNGQKFSGLSEKLSLNPRFFFFLVKNAKICFFEAKMVLSDVLYQI